MRTTSTSRRLLVLLAGSLALAVSPAGAATHVGTGSVVRSDARPHIDATVSLCQGATAQHVARLKVIRSRPLNPERFSFPGVLASAKVSRIRALARVVCSLPVLPKDNVTSCPNDIGVFYTLQFSSAGGKDVVGGTFIRPVRFDATGCRFLTGAGAARRSTPAMATALGAALGLAHPTFGTFAGALNSG